MRENCTYGLTRGRAYPAGASRSTLHPRIPKLTVEVEKSTDLQTWEEAKTVEVIVPAIGEQGFYILKSK